jgi:adenosylcobinamide kinase/adenosylcobinamide-phosphate guanylyltransferase
MARSVLVLGGARSGKSRLAETLAQSRGPVSYVATALVDPADHEMVERVRRHRERRPADWTTYEVPGDLAPVLRDASAHGGSIVVDCVTFWISHLMLGLASGAARDDDTILDMVSETARAAIGPAQVLWVSNEVGCGIVPENPLGRRFADLQGLVNQRLAAHCDEVHFCVAGLSVRMK